MHHKWHTSFTIRGGDASGNRALPVRLPKHADEYAISKPKNFKPLPVTFRREKEALKALTRGVTL